MKTQKAAIKTHDFRVWCARCSIRIAPHEKQIAVEGQTYHLLCHSKKFTAIHKDASSNRKH